MSIMETENITRKENCAPTNLMNILTNIINADLEN